MEVLYREMDRKKNYDAFFALLKAGLWEKDVRLSPYKGFDLDVVYQIAEQQAVIGLVATGLEHITDTKTPQEKVYPFICSTLEFEQRNAAMNNFIGNLSKIFAETGIYALLIKGQGIAQCYERPLWRTCGDIDLLLDVENYIKAKNYLHQKTPSEGKEDPIKKHFEIIIDSWLVELHGSLRTLRLPNRADQVVEGVLEEELKSQYPRHWKNGDIDVKLPSANNDIIFVFYHILQHIFGGGIGLRQICDWCRLLWTYKDSINHELLLSRLESADLITEWKVFAAYTVEYLDMPIEAMPLYSNKNKWKRKAHRLNRYILRVGNFGQNRSVINHSNNSDVVKNSLKLWRYTGDAIGFIRIFPIDAIKVWLNMIKIGVNSMISRDICAKS